MNPAFNKSREYIEVSFFSFEFVNDNSNYNFPKINRLTQAPINGSAPNCNTRCGVWSDTSCGPFDCSSGCDETNFGCGFLWLQDFTGKC